MALRAGMEDLINHVARLINDEDYEYHSEQDIQDALDQHRAEARYVDVDAVKSVAEGGAVTYLTYIAPRGLTHWETTGTLLDYDYATLTPSASDWMAGRWTFSSEPTQPVRLLGFTFDVFMAAADLLDVRSSMLAEDLQSFSAAQGSYTYAAKAPSLRNQAKAYRAKARVMSIDLVRDDVNVLL